MTVCNACAVWRVQDHHGAAAQPQGGALIANQKKLPYTELPNPIRFYPILFIMTIMTSKPETEIKPQTLF